MKKLIYSGALLVLVSFSACKKDYTCECVMTDGQTNHGTTSVTITESKKDAENACKAGNSTITSGGTTMTTTCTLK
ncbi:MAG TPA: hypothetical protein VK927_11405 [Adhaeribacter sp.]|nr:hypothetical protein [Adhaeribacter sp.]